MKKLTSLTRKEILSFCLVDIWYTFIRSVASEFKKELDTFIKIETGKMSHKFPVSIEESFESVDSPDATSFSLHMGNFDELLITIGNFKNTIAISFCDFRTEGLRIVFKIENEYEDERSIKIKQLFQKETLEICTNWILTSKLPENLTEAKEGEPVAN